MCHLFIVLFENEFGLRSCNAEISFHEYKFYHKANDIRPTGRSYTNAFQENQDIRQESR
jgi:hypothetical protein